ncbi:hypothetical protein GCM10011352_32920 [Marinobacterium zhoushanense]|uniref:YARHG domain-containing protein n=1 Tax=Marinobacterium zhoushanense TaxID=1679163 RepID=A0ABQ1KPZ2_9GAMM|nr:hypothetical protein [Marinobacterium zhoushanense]GGC04078.1 hypothetical protein GCM10011352_32920 [Marinobacterium zhoushanense]
MRTLIILCLLIWNPSAFSQQADDNGGISEEVRDALYSEGMQEAVYTIDNLDNPSGDEVFLALYLVSEFKFNTSRLNFYKSNEVYKKSTSYKLNYYFTNLPNLNKEEVEDLNHIAKDNQFAEKLKYLREFSKVGGGDDLVRVTNAIPRNFLSHEGDNLVYYLFSHIYSGFILFYYKRYEMICDGFHTASPRFFIFDKFFYINEMKCGFNQEDVDLFSLALPIDSDPKEIVKLSDSQIDRMHEYWKERLDPVIWNKYFDNDICSDRYSLSNRKFKICHMLSPTSNNNCALSFWSDIDNSVTGGGRNKWRDSKGFNSCKDEVIKEYVGG